LLNKVARIGVGDHLPLKKFNNCLNVGLIYSNLTKMAGVKVIHIFVELLFTHKALKILCERSVQGLAALPFGENGVCWKEVLNYKHMA